MPIDEADDLLLKAAGDIADGRAVDWDALAGRVDAAALARLRDLARLAGHFSDAHQALSAGHVDADIAAPPARMFAHLQVQEEIGRGSSGVVHCAFDPLLQRVVALKLCHGDGATDDLLREAQQMARIDHPGVLKIHGVQVVDGQVGFWSDLVTGESVAHRLQQQARVAPQEAIMVALELCSALAAIHQAGLVHGDVKAQNVVRRQDGRHVLIDFGSARKFDERTQVSGTPLYLAPELLAGGLNVPADDLYSVGVLLFRMMSGRFPVEGDSLLGLVEAHQAGRRLHLLDLVPQLDPRLAAVVERAIDPDRTRRFTRAGELAAALRQCLPATPGTESTQRLDETTQQPAPTARPASPRLAWLLAAGAIVLAVAALWWRWPAPAATPIETTIRMLRTTGGIETPLQDGDRIAVGDVLSMQVTLGEPAHVYVLNEDATGAVYQLFPLPLGELANPLPSDRRLRLPGRIAGRDQDWQVTSPGARERFYVLVSPVPVPDLHPANTRFAMAEAGRPLDRSALYAAARVTRGVGGLNERVTGSPDATFPVGDWLGSLVQRHPRARIERYELDNP